MSNNLSVNDNINADSIDVTSLSTDSLDVTNLSVSRNVTIGNVLHVNNNVIIDNHLTVGKTLDVTGAATLK